MIHTKTIRKMHTDFVASRDSIQCSLSTFFRYKPFYITPPSEREKKSHGYVLNAKTSIYFYSEQAHIAVLKILASIILSQNF